ncbi:S-adenosyl-L-methionine-dependent methyltransferases superfamily protein isoform X2 [Wolffia australiana]
MAIAKFWARIRRRRVGFSAKVCVAVLLGLVFTVVWSALSSPSSAVSSWRSSFGDVGERGQLAVKGPSVSVQTPISSRNQPPPAKKKEREDVPKSGGNTHKPNEAVQVDVEQENPPEEEEKTEEAEEVVSEEEFIGEQESEDGDDAEIGREEEDEEEEEKEQTVEEPVGKPGPVFDPSARYSWRSCGPKKGPHYIPCVDLEVPGSGKFQGHRHHERSCPRPTPLCLVHLPPGYKPPISWPESRSQIFFPNVAHPMLSAYIKSHQWLRLQGDLLLFPRNDSVPEDAGPRYIDFIEETAPDIEFGKNIRMVLDIQSADFGFVGALVDKGVLTISLGLMVDQTDLTQLSLERGFPAIVANLARRRLPFPSAVFDAIHCSDCGVSWHSRGGKPLLEMNRVLRPGGYFLLSLKQGDAAVEEGLSARTASLSWNVLAQRNDEENEFGIKIYQKPSSNDVYELRGTKKPPLCPPDEAPDSAWYKPIRSCLHTIPTAIEERGSDWPEEWPKRLDHFPEWLADSKERILADTDRWRATLNRSYLTGLGVDWPRIRNVMDMTANFGGFAAALEPLSVWVMNVVPVRAPKTLPIIFERGLLGVYHDWCEPFSSFPRSYDLLHADHLFSQRKIRCRQPVAIVAEIDRILRPGGWIIVRDKVEISRPLEGLLRSLRWEIRMTYAMDGEGLICAQKTAWRP